MVKIWCELIFHRVSIGKPPNVILYLAARNHQLKLEIIINKFKERCLNLKHILTETWQQYLPWWGPDSRACLDTRARGRAKQAVRVWTCASRRSWLQVRGSRQWTLSRSRTLSYDLSWQQTNYFVSIYRIIIIGEHFLFIS